MEKINPTTIIKRELRNHRMPLTEASRRLNLNPSTVNGMLHRNTIQVQRLIDMSHLLQYNFFREIADLLPYSDPVTTGNPINALNERIKELEMEVRILREMLKNVVGK